MDFYNFYTGKEFEAYEFLGAHTYWGGTTFRTFAPAAAGISVICSFNGWNEIPMNRIHDGNFWEVSINGTMSGDMYKYRIYKHDGSYTDHADPYGFFAELRPGSASVIYDIKAYEFNDRKWIKKRYALPDGPLNIYEIHFGSWQKKNDTDPNGFYSYTELADRIIPYLKEKGYNALEIMPLNEYPCDESWGYQSTGYFSPTSRYGTPDMLREFIDKCHNNDIAVILDFIPVHFAIDDFGLKNYDGTPLYEFPNSSVGYNEWGSCNFMHSRGETCSFLQSSANFWFNEYHFDGLRMDAVSNLIYWQGDSSRGENKSAIKFLQTMNKGLKDRHPDCLLFAEDSSSWHGVTHPVENGGLGFDFKWDLGWMHDTLDYFATGPDYRSDCYHKLTFSMMYYYNEKYILPLSHDEVVHGKATILQKMSDLYEGKFRQAKAFYMFMYAHPGKKLNFMGNEIGQLREWDEKREQDWDILKYPIHDEFSRFMSTLNNLYLNHPAFYSKDYCQDGFNWIDCNLVSENLYSFVRNSDSESILAIFNFSCYTKKYECRIGECNLKLLFSNDEDFSSVDVNRNRKAGGSSSFILPPFFAAFYLIKR